MNKREKKTEIKQKEFCFIKPEERICKFQESIESFYGSLKTKWLSTLNEKYHVETKEREYEIFEEWLGHYIVIVKEISVDNQSLFFKPVGTMFRGVYGRIDLIYGARYEMFVLIDKVIASPKQLLDRIDMEDSRISTFPPLCELEWKYASKYPDLRYEAIDSDVLFKIIKRVIYG